MALPPLLVIGAGSMAQAIISGATAAGALEADRVCVVDPNPEKLQQFPHGFSELAQGLDWLDAGDNATGRPTDKGQILLAVKPQHLATLTQQASGLREKLTGRIVISILAGSPSARIVSALGGGVRVIRIMPNSPVKVGRGLAALCAGDGVTRSDLTLATTLFSSVGEVIQIDERQMDAFTAVAGSGPAYLFLLAEAMLSAAVRMGFEQREAERIIRATILGSAELLSRSTETAAALRHGVTSPGGTTAAAIDVFDRAGFIETVIEALRAARDRGAELSRL